VRRIEEPTIVFTEYRDTLQHICAELDEFGPLTLHGGLTSRERAEVIGRFNGGETSLLLATDAASEGLNLHHRCRFVVNLELPWTPLRMEQRVGRVDRIGQARRVHALSLIAAGTHDEIVARQLGERRLRIQTALDHPVRDARLRRVSEREAARLVTAKSLSPRRDVPVWSRSAFLTSVRRPHRRGTVRAFQLGLSDDEGHVAFETIAGVHIDAEPGDVEVSEDIAGDHHQRVLVSVAAEIAPWLTLSRCREEAIVCALRENHARLAAGLLQPGLFDRRSERAAAAQTARVDEVIVKSRVRLDALERLGRLRCAERRLLFEIRFRP
jgi:hypothetical protein